jgi:N-acetylmuramoyl-L-alanine amidase
VLDLQVRLGALGFRSEPDDPGEFSDGTLGAVRAFQGERGLRVDGAVGRHTWSALVESGFTLGDRLLYFRHPPLSGDDVADLQRRLDALGFDVRRVDGLFGADTLHALAEFQRSAGLVRDGICGPSTIAALRRVGGFAAGSVAEARARAELRQGHQRFDGCRVFVASTPGLVVVGDNVARGLNVARAVAIHDAAGDDDSVVARSANRFGADLFVALDLGMDPGARCVYFATEGFRSEVGVAVATTLRNGLSRELPIDIDVLGRAYPVLRETRMPAVVCELAPTGDAKALAAVIGRANAVSRAIVRGLRRAWEQPSFGDS